MTRRPESSLTTPAMDWLRSRGAGSILGEVCTGDACLADLIAWLPDGSLAAVELKVSDWRCALSQAARNLWFTPYSWVGMAEEYIAPATRNLSAFESAGVGLLAVGTRSAKVILEARRGEPSLGGMPMLHPLTRVVSLVTAPLDGWCDLDTREAIEYAQAVATGAAFVRTSTPRPWVLQYCGMAPATKGSEGKTRVGQRRRQTQHGPGFLADLAAEISADLGLTGEESGKPC